MDRLTRGQIETFRRVAKTAFAGIRTDQVCDLALQSLSQEAMRDEALEEAAKRCEDEGECNDKVAIDSAKTCAVAIRALKREPNAAGQADLGPETDGTPGRSASGSPGGGAVHPDAEARAWGSEPGGASDRGARAGNVVARPAPAAPDVAKAVEEIRYFVRTIGERVPSQQQLEQWEPTDAMIKACNYTSPRNWNPRGIYRAMLSAAEAEGRKR